LAKGPKIANAMSASTTPVASIWGQRARII
jgi:hypothetical protein